MNKQNILFWMAVLTFFGYQGNDLLKVVSDLFAKLSGIAIIVILGLIWLFSKK